MMKLPAEMAALNPYRHIIAGTPDAIRLTNDCDRTHVFRIRSVVMDYGFINAAVSRFVKHLYDYCEQQQLTLTDRARLLTYVTNLGDGSIVGPSSCLPDQQGPYRDDGRGVEAMGSNAPRASHVKRPRTRKQATKGSGQGG